MGQFWSKADNTWVRNLIPAARMMSSATPRLRVLVTVVLMFSFCANMFVTASKYLRWLPSSAAGSAEPVERDREAWWTRLHLPVDRLQ
jgi:hypothetical protein